MADELLLLDNDDVAGAKLEVALSFSMTGFTRLTEKSSIPFPTDKLFTTELRSFDVIIFQNFDYRPYNMAQYLGNMQQTVVNEAYGALADSSLPLDRAVSEFLASFGHRATHDFELSEPRYREEPERIRERAVMLRDLAGGGTSAWLDGLRRRWARGEGA